MDEFIEIEFIDNQKHPIHIFRIVSKNDSTIMSNRFDKLLTNEFKTFNLDSR